MNNEIWKNIEGYPNYQVSNMGRVKSLNYNHTKKEKILKPHNTGNGYLMVQLFNNDTYKCKLIHRLVAETFISNPENKPCVDHINTDKTDNKVENLRWVTHKENSNNPISKNNMVINATKPMLGIKSKANPLSIPILQLSKKGTPIMLWYCGLDILREIGINNRNVSLCCKGKRKTAGGYRWQYLDDWLADWWDMEMDKVA